MLLKVRGGYPKVGDQGLRTHSAGLGGNIEERIAAWKSVAEITNASTVGHPHLVSSSQFGGYYVTIAGYHLSDQ